jgi:transposase
MDSGKLKERELIINFYKKKNSTRYIAKLLDISKSKAAYWVKRYKQSGKLNDLPKSGKPSKLTKQQEIELRNVFLDVPPSRYGGKSYGWLTKTAIQYVKNNYNITYSMRRMQELFHKFGISLITPRIEHSKASEAARKVYRLDFKKNSKTNIWIAPSLISTK